MSTDVNLQLDAIEELFAPAPPTLDAIVPGARPGIERVLDELVARKSAIGARLVVAVPPRVVRPGLDAEVAGAIQRWCRQRRRDNDHASGAFRRLGIGALLPGVVLLAIGLLAAEGVRRSNLPFDLRVLGDGIAIVVAWVAIWFPLDTLFYARAPYRRSNAALDAMCDMEVVITSS